MSLYGWEQQEVSQILARAQEAVDPRRHGYQTQTVPPPQMNIVIAGGGYPAPAYRRQGNTPWMLFILVGGLFVALMIFLTAFLLVSLNFGGTPARAAGTPQGQIVPLPTEWDNVTFAGVYGRPGGWGSLSSASTPEQAIAQAKKFAEQVDGWNGTRTTVPLVNPCIEMSGGSWMSKNYIDSLIRLAKEQGVVVMLDVQTTSAATKAVDDYLDENVWIDLDLEWSKTTSSGLSNIASYYFDQRAKEGYKTPGVVGFYVLRENQMGNHTRSYPGGHTVPLYDGHGGAELKLRRTQEVMGQYDAPWGIMTFYPKWGEGQYGDPGLPAKNYYQAFPDVLIFLAQ